MAFLQVSIMSECLMRTVSVNVILPVDKLKAPGEAARGDRPYKTLYLLHGMLGSAVDWINGTRIQRFAEEHDLAVVMPSGDNAFYLDQPKTNNFYGEYVGQELVALTRKMFPLSRKREDTFIGGLSMGGYGALRNGLKYSDTFGYIISLSGAVHLEELAQKTEAESAFFEKKSYLESFFGPLSEILEGDTSPKYLVRQLKKEGKAVPKIYMACGESDHLLNGNVSMYEFLKEQAVDVTFETGPGAHDWDFWDAYIKKAIAWLPTEKGGQGIHSGNVGI